LLGSFILAVILYNIDDIDDIPYHAVESASVYRLTGGLLDR